MMPRPSAEVGAPQSCPPPQSTDEAGPSGACLRRSWRRWRQLSSQAGKWTREGVRLPWLRIPRPCRRKQKELSAQEEAFLDQEVQRMLTMKAIKPTDRTDLVLSSIYTVPKKNGKRRPVINLRWVNKHIKKVHFKMATMKDVKLAITKNCWMASLDLTDCFWGLPLSEQDQRFVAFEWHGQKYTFNCLPFGLSLSPLYITKLYRSMVEHLQARGHRVIMYIDDILILADTKEECERSVSEVASLLSELGARINEGKSSRTPVQRIDYLGFTLDSTSMKIYVPPKKLNNTKKALKQFSRGGKATARDAASILGKLNSLADAVFPVRAHTTAIHDFKLRALARGSWDRSTSLPQDARDDIKWWLRHLQDLSGRPLLPPKVDYKAATDASDYGWGAWIQTPDSDHKTSWGGHFSKKLAALHINHKEMLAVDYFLRSCPVPLRGKVVDLGIDNTTTIWYLSRFGGRRHILARLAQRIWDFLMIHKITIVTYHLPGIENTLADRESRRPLNFLTDLQLSPPLFARVDRHFGRHTIDAFASFQDRQLDRFGSREPQPGALWVDSLKHSWLTENVWANPPFSLIFRILHKVVMEGSTITLLAPFWPGQPWFPMLLSLLIAPPLIIPQQRSVFVHPMLPEGRTPQWLTCAWRISGNPSKLKGMGRKLSSFFSRPGSQRLMRHMTSIGAAGLHLQQAGKKIDALLTSLRSARGWQN